MRRPLTPKEAADWLTLSEETLAQHRSKGTGPKYYKLPNGAIRYYIADLESWVKGTQPKPPCPASD